MSTQASFASTEWLTLQFAPLWIFSAVAAADRNIDKKEIEALAKELQEAILYKEPLVRDVLVSVATDFSNIMSQYKTDPRNVTTGLQDVADLLDKKVTPQQAQNFSCRISSRKVQLEGQSQSVVVLRDRLTSHNVLGRALPHPPV
jgi:hypothetical protein